MRTVQSRASLEALYARKYTPEEPDPNPDGQYWQFSVIALQFHLKELIGKENYAEWVELVWPDDTTDRLTWRDMYQQLDRTIEAVYSGTEGVFNWADAAKYSDNGNPNGLQGAM